jgi:hypothetical protein
MLGSCSKSDATATTRSYAGAGSEWNSTLNPDGTFVITHSPTVGAAADVTVNGTYVTEPTGFLLLTVGSATGTGAPAAGAQAYALEIPNTVFFLKPIGVNSNIIAMIPSGGCPATLLSENWIKMKVDTSWTAALDVNGTFTFDPTSGAATVTHKYSLNTPAGDLGTMAVGTGTCSGGLLSIVGGGAGGVDLFLTQTGGAIVHVGTANEGSNGDQIIFAMPPTSAAVAPTDLAGNYIGLVFTSSGGGTNFPAKLTLAAGGGGVTGPGYQISDVASGATTTGGAKLVINTAGISNGFVSGTMDTTSPTGGGVAKPMTCMALPNAGGSGHTILSCAALDQSNAFFSFLLTSI